MENYFIYIWLILVIIIVSIFFIQGKAVIKKFGPVDLSSAVYIEKFASGYSPKAINLARGGASKILHIIITDEELIIKTFKFMAHVAKKLDLMQRIPLERIKQTELKKKRSYSKLLVRYETEEGKVRDIVLISSNNARIKSLLDGDDLL